MGVQVKCGSTHTKSGKRCRRKPAATPAAKRIEASGPHRRNDARHGTVTLLTAADVPPRVGLEILGRSQIAVTMNMYAHVVQETQREAVGHMDRLLRQRPGRPDRSR